VRGQVDLVDERDPGITRSDLLVINKIDLAPHVGADLGVMERDARRQPRRAAVRVHESSRSGEGVDAIVAWLRTDLLLALAGLDVRARARRARRRPVAALQRRDGRSVLAGLSLDDAASSHGADGARRCGVDRLHAQSNGRARRR